MKQFNKITIIGVGLIGGSIGLAIKKTRLAREVFGVFRRKASLQAALEAKAIDRGTLNIREGVSGADLVIICTPVTLIPFMAKRLLPFMMRGAILTDVGSVKAYVVSEVSKMMPRGITFVGSHPMAGSEKTGVRFARPDLFSEAVTIVTKTAKTDHKALNIVAAFWRSLGSKVVITSPSIHDERVALISHLPHVLAMNLCLVPDEKARGYAANGFRDTTRIAASDSAMWIDIFKTNRVNIMKAIDRYIHSLESFKGLLKDRRFNKVLERIEKAKKIRDGLN